jgi:hypothetical protein
MPGQSGKSALNSTEYRIGSTAPRRSCTMRPIIALVVSGVVLAGGAFDVQPIRGRVTVVLAKALTARFARPQFAFAFVSIEVASHCQVPFAHSEGKTHVTTYSTAIAPPRITGEAICQANWPQESLAGATMAIESLIGVQSGWRPMPVNLWAGLSVSWGRFRHSVFIGITPFEQKPRCWASAACDVSRHHVHQLACLRFQGNAIIGVRNGAGISGNAVDDIPH